MKKILKNTLIIIVLIMILLSSFVPNKVFAENEDPDYDGTPGDGKFGVVNYTGWIINSLKDIFDWFVGISTYAIKAVFLGWANILEKAVTGIIEIGTATEVEESLTVEKIVTNKVPILDINFFNFSEAGGQKLDENSIIYMIRSSIAQFYYIIRNVAIGGMLVTLIYIGIRIALSSIAETRAKYKSMLRGWVESMVLVFFIHYIMVFIIKANEWFLSVISSSVGSGEEALYDTIKTQAYAIQASVGLPATIIYCILLYLLIKFIFIYLKRFANVAILTFLAPVIAISYSIDKIKDGKSQSLSKWLKDYTLNVLTQSVHCLLYFLFIKLAFDVAGRSIYGVALALFLISNISRGEETFKHIFGMSGGGAAPMDSLRDKPWKDTIAKAKLFKGAIKTNAKWVGGITGFATKPIRGLGKGLIKDHKVAKMQQAIYMARVTGKNTVNVKNFPFGKGKDYDIGQLLEVGQEMGYSDKDLAELFQSGIDTQRAENFAAVKGTIKEGWSDAGAILGMATSIPLISEDPITAARRFKNYRGKLKIKGYKKNSKQFKGGAKAAFKNKIANAGLATSIPVMAANPLLGAAMVVGFSRMKKQQLNGYSGGKGTYTAPKGTKRKIKNKALHRAGVVGTVASVPLVLGNPLIGSAVLIGSHAIRKISLEKTAKCTGKYKAPRGKIAQMGVDYLNFNTMDIVPMVRQVRNNLTERQERQVVRDLTYQYQLSNQILQKRIEEEYQRLANDPNVDQDELQETIRQLQSRITVEGINGDIPTYTDTPKVELKSYKDLGTVDTAETAKARRKEGRNDVEVVKANEDIDAVDFTMMVSDHASSGEKIIAEYDGVSVDSEKYSDELEMYKDIITKGGTIEEEEMLKKLNEEHGTDCKSLDEMYKVIKERKEQESIEKGELYVTGLDGMSDTQKKDVLDDQIEERERRYVAQMVQAVTMKASDEINSEGLTDEVIDLLKKKISITQGKKEDGISLQEVSKLMAAMSKEEIIDVMEVAVTKKSVLIKGKSPKEFRQLVSLMEQKKYNDYAISSISYDRHQASSVAEKIKISRAKGVK